MEKLVCVCLTAWHFAFALCLCILICRLLWRKWPGPMACKGAEC